MSGPGKVEVFQQSSSSVTALLYNFDVGKAILKPEHLHWLSKSNVLPLQLRRGEIIISTIGLTSRTGSDRSNMNLSKQRGDAVQSKVFMLPLTVGGDLRLRQHNEAYVGERAAQLIGIQDGVEDERWRAVLLNVREQHIPAYSPPRKFVERRVSVRILLKEEMKTAGGGEPGERAYQAAQAFRQVHGLTENIIGEKKAMIDQTFWVLRVTTSKEGKSYGVPIVAAHEQEYLNVDYGWGPSTYVNGRPPKMEYIRKADPRNKVQPEKDFIRPLDPVEAEDWLKRPLWTFHNHHST